MMILNASKIPVKLELHYDFFDNSHSMDATVRNNCERELLAITHEIASLLDIEILIESEAFAEGGLKEVWKFISKNQFLIGIITGILINVISTTISTDYELINLQKEELKLNIEKLRKDIEEEKIRDQIEFNINDAANNLNTDIKITKHKSNFYEYIYKYDKVKKITTILLTEKNEPVNDSITIERNQFNNFILTTDELDPIIDEKAKIEIISPVLTKGKYSWRGIYNNDVIPFIMKDKDFKNDVIQNGVSFKNGTFIECVLEIQRKITETGIIENTGYEVKTVLSHNSNGNRTETIQGKNYKRQKDYERDQGHLFSENFGDDGSE